MKKKKNLISQNQINKEKSYSKLYVSSKKKNKKK